MNAYNLRPLWDELLKIYGVFAAICDKHNLRYYACGGTALGAVRHQGFIPWDDDLDIFMPRRDYVEFVDIAQTELPSGLKWQSIENDPCYEQPFGKVRNIDCNLIDDVKQRSNLILEQGIFIDVLPLDGVPRRPVCLLLWLAFRSMLRHIPRVLTANQKARLMYQRFASAIDFYRADKVEDTKESARRIRRTNWTPNTFGDPIWMDFESVKMPLPKCWDDYLKGMFGNNYMQLPPVEKRVLSHQVI